MCMLVCTHVKDVFIVILLTFLFAMLFFDYTGAADDDDDDCYSSSATALKMEIKLIVLIVLNVVYAVHGVIPSECIQGVNCILPGCFCATFDHPNRTAKFPQIVYFAIDDALTVTVRSLPCP